MKEKSQVEKNAANKQVSLLSTALSEASKSGGYWLNASGKCYPRFYPKGVSVSAFNALSMALHSDQNGCKTNLFTLFSKTKLRGASVREHEQGVPFLYYNWNKNVHRNNPENIITRNDYLELDEKQRKQYKGIHNREIRTLFNIDQTTLPLVDKESYELLLKQDGNIEERGYTPADDRRLHTLFNDFLLKMRDNLVPVRSDGSGVPHYETDKDAIYMPRQKDFEHYHDYLQETLRQVVSATGHQQRLAREGMVMKNGIAPSEDAVKQERLVVELASGIKMLELGLPAHLSEESLKMVDYWCRELKENPCLIDALESDVNNAIEVISKAERGEKIEYATLRNHRETTTMQEQMPKHYFVADEIRQYPDKREKKIVLVIDNQAKTADVILPAGASTEVDNEIPGMNKEHIERALQKKGIEQVHFYNTDGALGYRPDDSYFAEKVVTLARMKNRTMETLSTLNVSSAVKRANEIGFEQVEMIRDDKKRWALYIKPENKNGYSIYPDKEDVNRFFSTLKQAMDNINKVRMELARKYYTLAEVNPNLKVDLFNSDSRDIDLNRIQRVCVYRTKQDGIQCAATIDGQKLQPQSITPQQWQRMWLTEDRDSYKRHLAAALFADVLKQGEKQEQTSSEKQKMDTEVKQEQQDTAERHEEEHREYHEEENKDERAEIVKQQEEGKDGKLRQNEDMQKKSGIQKQWNDLKSKHPDILLLFRTGDFYHMYNQDARKGAEILGITLTRRSQGDFKESAGFPYHALDIYLPRLIRAGERIAICDQLEAPKQQKQEAVRELVEPARGMRR